MQEKQAENQPDSTINSKMLLCAFFLLGGCDHRDYEAEREAMLAPMPPDEITTLCKGEALVRIYAYRDPATQGCWLDDDRVKCIVPIMKNVRVVCDPPELFESEARERWERFNKSVEAYQREKRSKS